MELDQLKRRSFITLLGGVAAWPIAARAQQAGKLPVVGLLSSRSPATDAPLIAVMREGLSEIGLVEGRNVTTDYRSAEGQYDRLASLAADLVQRQVTVIVAIGGEPAALAAKVQIAIWS
jgi:putative tryptophan/tyrosine transport system substrate-binding protein